ncbi:MAG: hypothetical protein R3B70_34160, partial [Polyangiaceae bacterium]
MPNETDPQPNEASPRPAASPRPKKRRRVLRIAAYVLATPLVLALLLIAYLHTSGGKARVRGLIVQRLGERVDGKVEVGGVDYALFGEVKVEGVRLLDPAGAEALSVGSLTVRPSWSDVLGGNIVLDSVSLAGLSVHVVKDADGGSNLKRLFKPQPADPNKKPLAKTISVKSLALSGVAAEIAQPDGTRIVLSDAAIEGALSVLPSDRTMSVELSKLGLSALIDKGEGGLRLGIANLTTGLSVKLDKGAGTATLHPLKGRVAVTLPGKEERGFDIGLAGFTADIGDDGVGVSLDKLLAGVVALASVEVKGRLKDGKIDGAQEASILGLTVRASSVNDLLGKDVLAGDIDLEAHVNGPPDKIGLKTRVTAPGATLALDGSIGVDDPSNPSYDVALTATDLDTEKLLAASLGVTGVAVEKVEAHLQGTGQKPDTADATARLQVKGVRAKGVALDALAVEATLRKGVLKIQSLDATALGQHITAGGEVELATKRVDLTASVGGDVGAALAQLKAAGIPVKSSLPPGAIRLPDGDLKVHVRGFLTGALDVEATADRLGVLGGTLRLTARTSLLRHDPPLEDGKKVTISTLDADARVSGIRLSSLLAMRGKKPPPGLDGTLSGDVHVEGTPEKPKARAVLGLLTSRTDGGKTARLSLTADITPGSADVRASLVPTGAGQEIFGLTARVPLSLAGKKKGVDPYRSLSVHGELPRMPLPELLALVPRDLLPEKLRAVTTGDAALSLDIGGTGAKPDGKLHLVLSANAVPGHAVVQKAEIDAAIHPAEKGLSTTADVGVWLDAQKERTALVQATADLSRSPLVGPYDLGYGATLAVGPVPLADLFMASLKVRKLGGAVSASGKLRGNREDLTAHIEVSGAGLQPRGKGPFDLTAILDLKDDTTSVDVKARAPGTPAPELLSLAGKVEVAGKGLLARLKAKDKPDPALALSLDVPRRTLASLSFLNPDLAERPGELSGSIPITGTAREPLAKGSLVLDKVPMVSGESGGAIVAVDAGKGSIVATIGAGLPDADKAPLKIETSLLRADIAKLGKGETLPIATTIRGGKIDIRRLVPAFVLERTKVGVQGALDWNMDIAVALRKAGDKTEIADGTVKGLLDLKDATIALPGTKRAYRDVVLHLLADGTGLHLDALRAHESDEQEKDRSIEIKGDVGLDKLKPTVASLSIAAEKWLLFGPRALGFADAPRGTLSLGVAAKADFTGAVRTVKVGVNKLDVSIPDRFERAHQPEDVAAGDLVFLDEDKVPVGKLPVPKARIEKAIAEEK